MPQRKQGLPRRPNTQWSRPRRGSPVVFCSGWCRLARISVRARSTSAGRSGDVGHPGPGVDAADEQRLDLVEVADPGQVALVEHRDADLLVGVLAAAGAAPRRGPSRARARRARGGRPAGPRRSVGTMLDVVQPVADALPVVGGQHHADVVAGPAAPLRAGPVDVPAAVHPEVGAQRPPVGRAGSAGACRAAPPRGPCCRSGRGRRAGGAGTHPGAASSRPARCSSAARPARRCLPRARIQSPRPSGTFPTQPV